MSSYRWESVGGKLDWFTRLAFNFVIAFMLGRSMLMKGFSIIEVVRGNLFNLIAVREGIGALNFDWR